MTPAERFGHRVAALRADLAERGLDGALISWAPHVRYFSGIVSEWTPVFLNVEPAARATNRPGVTELAIWAAVHEPMAGQVGAPFALEGNFASGPRTLGSEPQATNRRIDASDTVFIDLCPVIHGYAADLTRAFVAGQPTEAQREGHAVLTDALLTGAALLRPGVRAGDVGRAVRSRVAEALGGYVFPHHTGHALGLQRQEQPMLIPGGDTLLEAGMVIAIEPGPYLPDTGGMRIEGNYLITETGSESLSEYPLELFACG